MTYGSGSDAPARDGGCDAGRCVERLTASDEFKLLRKLRTPTAVAPEALSDVRLGIFADVETTGLDPVGSSSPFRDKAEVIEVALVPFSYRLDGTIVGIHEPYARLRQPSAPIPPEITAITGITDEMVRIQTANGRTIRREEIESFVEPADLMLCHNAKFDRPFLESLSPIFAEKPFACSIEDVRWTTEEGVESAKLAYLAAMHYGFFYDRHRATDDCHAAIEILGRDLPRTKGGVLAKLLASARRETFRILALEARFEFKDELRARGYRWRGAMPGKPKCWYRDLSAEEVDAELDALASMSPAGHIAPTLERLTAYKRYSGRSTCAR